MTHANLSDADQQRQGGDARSRFTETNALGEQIIQRSQGLRLRAAVNSCRRKRYSQWVTRVKQRRPSAASAV